MADTARYTTGGTHTHQIGNKNLQEARRKGKIPRRSTSNHLWRAKRSEKRPEGPTRPRACFNTAHKGHQQQEREATCSSSSATGCVVITIIIAAAISAIPIGEASSWKHPPGRFIFRRWRILLPLKTLPPRVYLPPSSLPDHGVIISRSFPLSYALHTLTFNSLHSFHTLPVEIWSKFISNLKAAERLSRCAADKVLSHFPSDSLSYVNQWQRDLFVAVTRCYEDRNT